MDIPEMAAEHEMAVEPQREAEQKEQLEEDEEHITLRRSDFLHFQDTLVDIRSQIRDVRSQFVDFQRDVRQDRLEVQEMFRAIMDRLPLASRPSAAPPAP
jgi:septal ring factor EnvC (AmiA/AmiB activator)